MIVWELARGKPRRHPGEPRRNFLYFFISLSSPLVLFSLLSHVYPVGHCCHGNIAVRLYRKWLELFFFRWATEVGMDEILLWLHADHFELKEQKSHRAWTKGRVHVGWELFWAVWSPLKAKRNVFLIDWRCPLYMSGKMPVGAYCSLTIQSCIPEIIRSFTSVVSMWHHTVTS